MSDAEQIIVHPTPEERMAAGWAIASDWETVSTEPFNKMNKVIRRRKWVKVYRDVEYEYYTKLE